MREVTRLLIRDFKVIELGYDFMGYEFEDLKDLSFHHVFIPKCISPKLGLTRGLYYWNGSILVKDTAHTYLHIIEEFDEDMFYDITSELIDEKINGRIDMENLRRIDDILTCFEREHAGDTRNSQPIIKERYLRRVLKKDWY